LPIKNIPIIKLEDKILSNEESIYKYITSKIRMYTDTLVAIAFRGQESPSYKQIQTMACGIIKSFEVLKSQPIIVVVENDFAKALGQTIRSKYSNKDIICIDGISTSNGDYIDIGKPIAGAIPVVVKTLIFNS
jgi:Ethanolamine utilization protein, possible chaperonin protecting lyase from inhibition